MGCTRIKQNSCRNLVNKECSKNNIRSFLGPLSIHMVQTTVGGLGKSARVIALARGSWNWCWCGCIGMWGKVLLVGAVGVWRRVEVALWWWRKSGWLGWAES